MNFVKILNLPRVTSPQNSDFLVIAREGAGGGTFKTTIADIYSNIKTINSPSVNLYYDQNTSTLSADTKFLITKNTPSIELKYDTVINALTAKLNTINTENTPTINLRYDTNINALTGALVSPIGILRGGTGLTTPPGPGGILIGNGTGYNIYKYRDGLKIDSSGNFLVALEPGGGLAFNTSGELKIANKATFIDINTSIFINIPNNPPMTTPPAGNAAGSTPLAFITRSLSSGLTALLLSFYNNSVEQLDSKVFNITRTNQLFWPWVSPVPSGSTKVVSIIFVNETGSTDAAGASTNYFNGAQYPFNSNQTPTLTHINDIAVVKNRINQNTKFIIVQLKNKYGNTEANSNSNGVKTRDYIYTVAEGLGAYSGNNGLSNDKENFSVVYDVEPTWSPSYIVEKVYSALIQL